MLAPTLVTATFGTFGVEPASPVRSTWPGRSGGCCRSPRARRGTCRPSAPPGRRRACRSRRRPARSSGSRGRSPCCQELAHERGRRGVPVVGLAVGLDDEGGRLPRSTARTRSCRRTAGSAPGAGEVGALLIRRVSALHSAQPTSPGATRSITRPSWVKPAESIDEMLSLRQLPWLELEPVRRRLRVAAEVRARARGDHRRIGGGRADRRLDAGVAGALDHGDAGGDRLRVEQAGEVLRGVGIGFSPNDSLRMSGWSWETAQSRPWSTVESKVKLELPNTFMPISEAPGAMPRIWMLQPGQRVRRVVERRDVVGLVALRGDRAGVAEGLGGAGQGVGPVTAEVVVVDEDGLPSRGRSRGCRYPGRRRRRRPSRRRRSRAAAPGACSGRRTRCAWSGAPRARAAACSGRSGRSASAGTGSAPRRARPRGLRLGRGSSTTRSGTTLATAGCGG